MEVFANISKAETVSLFCFPLCGFKFINKLYSILVNMCKLTNMNMNVK